ncbi:MAG TPA: Smr/MutS family protein [Bdellovibrionales bacterium]|nr:Smr/MutS family protein [Bdellovibrionales bacterium]
MTERIRNLDWDEILTRLANFATSQVGRDRLRALEPLSGPAEAERSFTLIIEAMQVLALGRRPFMESLDLYPVWHQRLRKEAVLKTLELKDVRHFCLETLALKEIFKEAPTPWTKEIVAALFEADEPLSAIDQIMTPEGDIRSDASETLFKLFHEKNQIVRQTQNILDRLIRQHELEPMLQDRYVTTREGRWVLPIRSGKQNQFEGITHASSQSKATVFMEPKEIIPLNNRLRQIELDIEEEIERLLQELSAYLLTRLSDFETAQKILIEADVRLAQGQLAGLMQGAPCRFDETSLSLIELKHPLLLLANVDVVANDVQLNSDRRILLLSGPNAGGKTVLLKAVGLAAQMARCGLLIAAAPGSKLPFFEKVFVAVGDAQSVDQHLSTFAAHLKILNEATHAHGSLTLLLIDEICGSTDPEEGTALARAFIHSFAKNGSFGVITSHLGPLKLGWDENSGVVNGSLEYDAKSGQPTYMFLMGVPGQSLAIQTAKRVGVDPEIVKNAMELLSPEVKRYLTGLDEVEQMKEELRKLPEDTARQGKEAKAEKSRYMALLEKFERDKDKMVDQAVRRAEKKIDTMIEHSKVEDVFRRHERLEQIKHEMPEVIKASAVPAKTAPKIETAEDFARAFPPGSKVFATSIGRDAVIQGVPNGKGEVAILSNSMRLMVSWQQLRPPAQAMNPTVEIARRVGAVTSPLDEDRTIDVRGQTLDQALHMLEDQLDTAAVNDESRIKIVHGHGTDTLKKGIRGYLSRSNYVKKWKAGTPDSGGDGVTWVELS